MATLTEEQRNQRFRELISDDSFLEKLAEAGRLSGWNNDYVEVQSFIEDCFHAANKTIPDLEPYNIIE